MAARKKLKTISRRAFLKKTLFGTLAIFFARFIRSSELSFRQPESPEKLLFFSAKEYRLVEAIARRMVGKPPLLNTDASDLEVALRADRFLAMADDEIQEQFHLLLKVFNSPLFAALFDLRFSSFLAMNPKAQDAYLQDWMTSKLAFRRTGFQALKRLILGMYYTQSATWPEIGYEGMFQPEERL